MSIFKEFRDLILDSNESEKKRSAPMLVSDMVSKCVPLEFPGAYHNALKGLLSWSPEDKLASDDRFRLTSPAVVSEDSTTMVAIMDMDPTQVGALAPRGFMVVRAIDRETAACGDKAMAGIAKKYPGSYYVAMGMISWYGLSETPDGDAVIALRFMINDEEGIYLDNGMLSSMPNTDIVDEQTKKLITDMLSELSYHNREDRFVIEKRSNKDKEDVTHLLLTKEQALTRFPNLSPRSKRARCGDTRECPTLWDVVSTNSGDFTYTVRLDI